MNQLSLFNLPFFPLQLLCHRVAVAEAASLALGIASVFTNSLEWFRLVRVASDFGGNLETCQLQLDLAGIRLCRWGKFIGLESATSSTDVQLSSPEKELAQGVPQHIFKLIQETEKQSAQLKQPEESQSRVSGLAQKIQCCAMRF
ncbi:prion-inhibition and propagation-domain-containing protein [Clohesyomyces aquaticus]|uniref:Prion-inhibition and propagation-domain-containing protein n=1 Tax=Clohesyomyces aquaticus TaxID=1231657 RepID=A0A1Y1ZEH3_9PLEO|nr:prion-inhibition and propagation-domain-containing protein [Clohesyomyces aquaticus]